jgi:hypothetical protein
MFTSFTYRDGDSVLDSFDNCLEAANGDQADTDGDGVGLYIVDIVYRRVSKSLYFENCQYICAANEFLE